MLIPLPIDVGPKPIPEASEGTLLESSEKCLVDFGSVVEQAIDASTSADQKPPLALSQEGLPTSELPSEGLLFSGELALEGAALDDGGSEIAQTSNLPLEGTLLEGEILLSQLSTALPLETSLSEGLEGLAVPSEPVALMSISQDEKAPEILVAQTELGDAETSNQTQSVDQLMPLVGGEQEVGLELGRIRLESEEAPTGIADPRMTQPLQDAVLRVNDGSSVPVGLSPMDSLPVQVLLDSEAIDAKQVLRQEALSMVRAPDPTATLIGSPTGPGSLDRGIEPSALKDWSKGVESTPWFGLQSSSEGLVAPDKALGAFQATSEVLPPIEHALLAANLSEGKDPRAALDIKSMPAVQPHFTPQQSAPWAQALLDSSAPSTAPVINEQSPAPESQDEDGATPESQFASDTRNAPLKPIGGSESGSFRSPLASSSNSTGEPLVAQAAVPTENEPGKPPRVLQAARPSQVMTPQMAMATDDVAEFTVVKPDRMDLRIQDIHGDLELSVSREEEGLAVKVRAPQEVLEDFQGMESDLEAALSEDEQELASFETESNDQDQSAESDRNPDGEGTEMSASVETRGARVLSRLA